MGHIAADDLTVAVNIKFCAIQTLGSTGGDLLQRDIACTGRGDIRFSRLGGRGDQFSRRIIVKKTLAALYAGLCPYCPFCGVIFNNRSNDALCGVLLDLFLEGCVLLCFFGQHPVNIAKIGFVGIRVGVAAAVNISIALTLEGLVIPHIGLCCHEEAAGNISLVIDDIGHHPLEVFELLSIQFSQATLRQGRFQNGIRIGSGGRGIGVAVQETGGSPAITITTIHAVEHFPRCHGRLIAVRRSVMEQASCPVICVAGRFDAGAGAGRCQCRGRQQTQNGHQYEQH